MGPSSLDPEDPEFRRDDNAGDDIPPAGSRQPRGFRVVSPALTYEPSGLIIRLGVSLWLAKAR